MSRCVRFSFALVLAFLGLSAPGAAQQPAASGLTTVILVRHAERGPDEGLNSPILEKGRVRAEALARALKDSGITAIIVSEYIRTRQTAEPLARLLKLEPETVPQQKGVDALEAAIRAHRGQTILVCSHRGRIEPLVEKLGGKMTPIPDPDYDHLYILTLPDSGTARLLVLQYEAHPN